MIAERIHYAPAPQLRRKGEDGIALHGTRTRYITHKCRCEQCRQAIRDYERKRLRRKGYFDASPVDWEAYLVSAAEARRHLLWLAENGIGLKSVKAVSGVNHNTLWAIKTGHRKRIYGATRDRILGVTRGDVLSARDGVRVPGAETWRLIDEILAAGFSRAFVAQALGSNTPALQLSREWVTSKHMREVMQLHDRLWRENAEGGQVRSRWGWKQSGIRFREACACHTNEDEKRERDRIGKRRERAGETEEVR